MKRNLIHPLRKQLQFSKEGLSAVLLTQITPQDRMITIKEMHENNQILVSKNMRCIDLELRSSR